MLRFRDFSKIVVVIFKSVIAILLCCCLLLSACKNKKNENTTNVNGKSEWGDDSVTSSEIKNWLDVLEEWDESSKTDSITDFENSFESENDKTVSDSSSSTASSDKDSYENNINWTQGWY